jgi:hypothetical protein
VRIGALTLPDPGPIVDILLRVLVTLPEYSIVNMTSC